MGTQRIEDLLKALAAHGIGRARPGLAPEIKSRIPNRLTPHRMDSVGILAELKISRLAAAATILVALLVTGSFFGGADAVGKQMYEDSKLLLQYTLAGENACRSRILSSLMQFRDDMAAQGREVVFYGDQVDFKNRYAIVMYWKLSDDKYGLVLGDLSTWTVSSDTLIRLQTHMLRDRSGK
ncbi:MAG TPA: hypothetical protein PKH24_02565 [Sedimentisphaerales bacterium]|jgi:hypothetical protein|nr:hypothetical protein [Sedimentisphaerales bacterium]HNU28284.1 hypothetical protein [Sedimentisphaerales bacterium]